MFLWPLELVSFCTPSQGLFSASCLVDFEQVGHSFTFLGPQVECDGPAIHWGLENKLLARSLTPNPTILCSPSPGMCTKPKTIHGLAVPVAGKAPMIWELTWLPVLLVGFTYLQRVPKL